LNEIPWTHEVEGLLQGKAQKYRLASDGAPLRSGEALRLLAADESFREFLTLLLAASPCPAFRWEMPPLSTGGLDRPFEFVLVRDPGLDRPAEPAVFAAHFSGADADADVLAVPNLGGTALLLVPRQLGEASSYTHLGRFLRGAGAAQAHALWRCVAQTAQRRLSAAPLWISTAGGGVAWLHVRVENTPKYYSYRPYADDLPR